MRNSERKNSNGEAKGRLRKVERADLSDDVDALFRLSLAEFTGARNTLAAQLKKSGRVDEALRVKALVKPSVSAWAVNQLYWNHRDAFDRLIASGERFHKAQASRVAARLADMRVALEARRQALTHLSDLATALLQNAGHNPSPDTIHRIITTLEALSAYASRADAPRPGRLTQDVDPPGFESLASLTPGAAMTGPAEKPLRFTPSTKSSSAPANARSKAATADEVPQREDPRKAKIAAAKVSLEEAKRSLTEARSRARSLETEQKKADAETKKAEKHRRDAEESLEKAKAASEDAARRARSVAAEAEQTARAVKYAERIVEKASKELESLLDTGSV